MAYIGQDPVIGRYIIVDQISGGFNGTASGFTLAAGSQGVVPGLAQNVLLSLGGVIQQPGTDYTVSGSGITFTTPPLSGTTFFATVLGDVQAVGTPSDGTVLPASIATSGTFVFPNITTTGTTLIASGNASTPSLAIIGDTNTGLYSPGADQLAISTGGTGRLFVDASGNVGVNETTPLYPLVVRSAGTCVQQYKRGTTVLGYIGEADQILTSGLTTDLAVKADGNLVFGAGSLNERLRITSAGLVGIGTSGPTANFQVAHTSTTPSLSSFAGSAATFNGSSTIRLSFGTYPAPNYTSWIQSADSSGNAYSLLLQPLGGNVGIGTTSPAVKLDVNGDIFASGGDIYTGPNKMLSSDSIIRPLIFGLGAVEKARIDSSGRLLVGTSTARSLSGYGSAGLQVESTGFQQSSISAVNNENSGDGVALMLGKSRGTTLGSATIVQSGDQIGGIYFQGADGSALRGAASIVAFVDGTPGASDMPGRLGFFTTADGTASSTERMRITQNGAVLVGKTSETITTVGAAFYAGVGNFTVSAADVMEVNRLTNDGGLINFRQDTTVEGSISVSGTTVSYNGAHLSRWSQLPSGTERTEILRGSVLSNIDEMCEWGDEENEQLNRMKVSDVEGDKNVSGVFQAWDDDDDTYINDFYCAMTGDFIIRIAEGVTVERGDLLMSAGDGTAKPQDDDIIRSKTIAKVTSTNVSCTYPDGSYCVPCVLMAC